MRWFLLLLVMFLALPASAVENEFVLGGTGAVRFTSNAQGEARNADDSIGFEIGPRLSFRSTADNFNFGARYVPTYARNSSDRIQNEWRQQFRMDGNYQYSPATSFTLENRVSYGDSSNKRENVQDANGNAAIERRNQNELTTTTALAGNHRINMSNSLLGNFSHTHKWFDDRRLRKSNIYALTSGYNHRLDERLTLGTRLRASHVVVGRVDRTSSINVPDGSNSSYFTAGVHGAYLFTPRISFNASVGPTLIVTRNDNLNNPDSQLTVFGTATLTANRKDIDSNITFTRREGFNTDSAVAQTDNQVVWKTEWRPARDWTTGLRLRYIRRDSVSQSGSGVSGLINSKLDQYSVAATVGRRLRREVVLHFTVDFLQQNNHVKEGGPTLKDDVKRWNAAIRLDFNMAPFKF